MSRDMNPGSLLTRSVIYSSIKYAVIFNMLGVGYMQLDLTDGYVPCKVRYMSNHLGGQPS